eukprot:snap_masked-scaffold_10-processed-gene-12.43-mRNA-1 protein AED:1.00 eAED:1.00 QI:0/0/0/0/1/1/2/0/137
MRSETEFIYKLVEEGQKFPSRISTRKQSKRRVEQEAPGIHESEEQEPREEEATTPEPSEYIHKYILQPHPSPFMLSPYLGSLDPEGIIAFLHSYNNADTAARSTGGQHFNVLPHINDQIVRRLREMKKITSSVKMMK